MSIATTWKRTWTRTGPLLAAAAVLALFWFSVRPAPDPVPGTEEFRLVVERDLVARLAEDDGAARARFDLLAEGPMVGDPPRKKYALWYQVEPRDGAVRTGVAVAEAVRMASGLRFLFRTLTRAEVRERPEIVFGRFPETLHREILRRAGASYGDPILDAETVSESDVLGRLASASREERRVGAWLAARHRMASAGPRLLPLLDALDEHGDPDVLLWAHALDAFLRSGAAVDPAAIADAAVTGVETEAVLLLARMEPTTEGRSDALRGVVDVAPENGRAELLAEVLLADVGDTDAVASLVDRLRVALKIHVIDPGGFGFGGAYGGSGSGYRRSPGLLAAPPRAEYCIEFAPGSASTWWPEAGRVVVESPLRVESIRYETRDLAPSPRSIGAGERDDVARATLGAILGDERLGSDDGREYHCVEWRGSDRLRADVATIREELHAGHRALIDRLIDRGLLTPAHAERPPLEISMQVVDRREDPLEVLPREFR